MLCIPADGGASGRRCSRDWRRDRRGCSRDRRRVLALLLALDLVAAWSVALITHIHGRGVALGLSDVYVGDLSRLEISVASVAPSQKQLEKSLRQKNTIPPAITTKHLPIIQLVRQGRRDSLVSTALS